jgi:hypothetical protein
MSDFIKLAEREAEGRLSRSDRERVAHLSLPETAAHADWMRARAIVASVAAHVGPATRDEQQ